MAELKPCPFCGGEAQFEPKNWCGRDYVGVFCVECNLFMDTREPDESGAARLWNTRAALSGISKVVEAAEFARDQLNDDPVRSYIAERLETALSRYRSAQP